MGAEDFVDVGARSAVGRLLDAQRDLARADRAFARPRLF